MIGLILGIGSRVPTAIWIAGAVALLWVGTVWAVRLDRDRYWRAEIRAQTAIVEGGVKVADVLIKQTDVEGLDDLKRDKDEAEAEVVRLKAERDSTPLSDACSQCRVPSRRVRP